MARREGKYNITESCLVESTTGTGWIFASEPRTEVMFNFHPYFTFNFAGAWVCPENTIASIPEPICSLSLNGSHSISDGFVRFHVLTFLKDWAKRSELESAFFGSDG